MMPYAPASTHGSGSHSGGRRITRADFEDNLAEKIGDKVFLSDVPPLLAFGVSFDAGTALERVRHAFISRLPEGTSEKKKERRPR